MAFARISIPSWAPRRIVAKESLSLQQQSLNRKLCDWPKMRVLLAASRCRDMYGCSLNHVVLTWGRRGKSDADRLIKKSHSSLHCTMVQRPKIAVRVMV